MTLHPYYQRFGEDLGAALEELEAAFGVVVVDHRWTWRSVPFGPCPRCRWPAHTLGPNGSPFHPYCWGNAAPVTDFERWLWRKAKAGEWEA
jgi:hypothetical protein